MKVYDCKLGRLGNAIFRYFASTLFCIIYNTTRIYDQNNCQLMFSDDMFVTWSNDVLNNKIPEIDDSLSIMFYGYYQHDKIFIKYKKKIINWIITHPEELLYTDGNYENIKYFNYDQVSYKSLNLIVNPFLNKRYNVVVHLRLEDFIINNDVIHPKSIKELLDKINEKNICFVLNKTKNILEEQYINYFKKFYNIIVESNSVIEDYHIMKNAKILICSCSTLSWAAAFLSDTIKLVYFPDYKINRTHETFKKPINNTILYPFTKCSQSELELFLNKSKNNKIDNYCAVDCKKKPITKRILEYIQNIENGFYIEAGAYDGLLQSNTKFLEEEYNWTGMLIEPSPNIFKELNKNRPNNLNINKCLVNPWYSFKTIKGSFDNGPMSSVNNIRKLENVKLIDVPCDTLENILDYYEIKKIDFMTIDTEGYELEVLQGLNLLKYRPLYILIEVYETQKEILFQYLEDMNYIFLENITNYNILDNPGWDGTHNDYLFKAIN